MTGPVQGCNKQVLKLGFKLMQGLLYSERVLCRFCYKDCEVCSFLWPRMACVGGIEGAQGTLAQRLCLWLSSAFLFRAWDFSQAKSESLWSEQMVHLCSCMHAKSLQSCPTLYGPMNYNPPGSSVHGILQARILEWVAMPSSRGSSRPRDWTWVSYVSRIGGWILYHWRHLGSPHIC